MPCKLDSTENPRFLRNTQYGERYKCHQTSSFRSRSWTSDSLSSWIDGATEWKGVKSLEVYSDSSARVTLVASQMDSDLRSRRTAGVHFPRLSILAINAKSIANPNTQHIQLDRTLYYLTSHWILLNWPKRLSVILHHPLFRVFQLNFWQWVRGRDSLKTATILYQFGSIQNSSCDTPADWGLLFGFVFYNCHTANTPITAGTHTNGAQ